jgi:Tfp pilus assembly protein PilO
MSPNIGQPLHAGPIVPPPPPEPVQAVPAVRSDPAVNVARNKLRDNKIIFYGIPLLVVLLVLGGVLFFVLPTAQYYSEFKSQSQILDRNMLTVDKSISNLNAVYAKEGEMKSYDTALSEYIPVDPKLGDVINLIQSKAKDFNLESKVGIYNGTNNTSVENLAKKTTENQALFESISSGEIVFKPRSLNEDVEAVLLSIEVNIKGERTSFMNFVSEIKNVKPVINLVFVEYTESAIAQGNPTVTALLRFESYALKLNTDNVQLNSSPKAVSVKDELLVRSLTEEKFRLDPALEEQIKIQTSGDSNY